jgi:hypothetical protein
VRKDQVAYVRAQIINREITNRVKLSQKRNLGEPKKDVG